jgi:flavin-binding protein dodecin
MTIIQVAELLVESSHGWQDATHKALLEASNTIQNIQSIYLQDYQTRIEDGGVVNYRVHVKVSYKVTSNV